MAARKSPRATAPVVVLSPLYPELLVLSPRVEFHDGVAEVTAAVAKALQALPEEFGLQVADKPAAGGKPPTKGGKAASDGAEPAEEPEEGAEEPEEADEAAAEGEAEPEETW